MVVHSQITSSLNPNVVDLQNSEIASSFTNFFIDISKGSLLVLLSQDLVIRQWAKILYTGGSSCQNRESVLAITLIEWYKDNGLCFKLIWSSAPVVS